MLADMYTLCVAIYRFGITQCYIRSFNFQLYIPATKPWPIMLKSLLNILAMVLKTVTHYTQYYAHKHVLQLCQSSIHNFITLIL